MRTAHSPSFNSNPTFYPHSPMLVRPPIKCRCVDADFKSVECGEILWRLHVDVIGGLRLGLCFGSSVGL